MKLTNDELERIKRLLAVSDDDLKSRSRKASLVKKRRFLIAFLKEKGCTTREIGEVIGRDHSSISYNIGRYRDLMDIYPDEKSDYQEFRSKANGVLHSKIDCTTPLNYFSTSLAYMLSAI